jgi:hypothetical protein
VAFGLLAGDQLMHLMSSVGEVEASVLQLGPDHGSLPLTLEQALILCCYGRLQGKDRQRRAILGADRSRRADAQRPIADTPRLDRDVLPHVAQNAGVHGRPAGQLDTRPPACDQLTRTVCKGRRKVVGTGQMGERETGLQEQMLSVARIAHTVGEATGHSADSEKGDAAREHAYPVETGGRAEHPDSDQSEREGGGSDARKQAQLERRERDRDDVQKLGGICAVGAGLAQREAGGEQACSRRQHHDPPL